MLELVNDLIYDGVSSFHFDFGVGDLSFDSVSDHTESVAVNTRTEDRGSVNIFRYLPVILNNTSEVHFTDNSYNIVFIALFFNLCSVYMSCIMSNILKQFHTFSSAGLQTEPHLTRNMQLKKRSQRLWSQTCYKSSTFL